VTKRITIVLGAGGPVGHAFHSGLMKALADGVAFDPRDAHLVIGTSAGAQVGALMRAGMSGHDLSARVTGEPMSDEGHAVAQHWNRPSHDAPPLDAPRPYRPGSTRYLQHVLRRPWSARPARVVSALLPEGRVCMKQQVAGLQRVFGHEWPERALWITAVCLHSGERLTFGREGAPKTDVGTAVAASGAVPSVCVPPEVDGRPLVDGGMHSPTHLDLLEDTDADVVLVSSPLSMISPMRFLLGKEVRRLRARGKRVVVFEPEGEALSAMGRNPMDVTRAPEVARATHRAMLRRLERPSTRRILGDVL
jgi:NTE family protein